MNYYWLLFFDANQPRRPAVLRQLLANRQKGSALYFGMLANWLQYIGLFSGFDEAKFDHEIQQLVTAAYLEAGVAGLTLSAKGVEFINENDLKLELAQPKLFRIFPMELVANLILLAVQVASEASYQNKQYYVVTDNVYSQYLFKRWLTQSNFGLIGLQEENQNKQYYVVTDNVYSQYLFKRWLTQSNFGLIGLQEEIVASLATFLANEPPQKAAIFAQKLRGHNFPGQTNEQLATIYGKFPFEIEQIWLDLLSRFAYYLYQGDGKLAELMALTQPNFEPVRASRFKTINAFMAGNTIKKIASRLHIKENTVLDHLYEAYIWHGKPDLLKLVSAKEQELMTKLFVETKSQEEWSYQDLVAVQPEIAFYKFRIFEIARGRKRWQTSSNF
ncbi:helix-turn-helix domain-containing protein [Ligilactobacillus agilis]|uniref:helix-turn-helix domain-containing protein n=1 Tax=Ligilactobacillus agilis TaxID=1601 RepID=UPI001F568428|nr:helix-turn-helix domain-containing protein [Ligilactobacillus agilis]UNL57869.1 hypothetical protein G8B19_03405 [Ligilactobacillus agilis]